jgi:hypothetical protein
MRPQYKAPEPALYICQHRYDGSGANDKRLAEIGKPFLQLAY